MKRFGKILAMGLTILLTGCGETAPEHTEAVPLTYEEVSLESLFDNAAGYTVLDTEVKYPKFSGLPEEINTEVEEYARSLLERDKEDALSYGMEDGVMDEGLAGFFDSGASPNNHWYTFIANRSAGGLLTVSFIRHSELSGGAPDYWDTETLAFDVNTGDTADIRELIGDKENFALELEKALTDFVLRDISEDSGEYEQNRERFGRRCGVLNGEIQAAGEPFGDRLVVTENGGLGCLMLPYDEFLFDFESGVGTSIWEPAVVQLSGENLSERGQNYFPE